MLSSLNRICVKMVLMGLLLLFPGFQAMAQPEDPNSSGKPTTDQERFTQKTDETQNRPPEPEITCIFVGKVEIPKESTEQEANSGGGNKNTSANISQKIKECKKRNLGGTALIGAGYVGVITSKDDYDRALEHMRDRNIPLVLYVNGVSMGSDAKLLAVEIRNKEATLVWNIKPGKISDELWAKLYQNVGSLTGQDNLTLALGWPKGPVGPYFGDPGGWTIQITDEKKRALALTFVALLVLLFIWIAWKTDALRDTPLPWWWREAELLRERFAQKEPKNIDYFLKENFNFYESDHKKAYEKVAEVVLKRDPIPDNVKPEELIIGLILLGRRWKKPIPAAFSLSRVQLGVWFLFAVATGVFLSVIYGKLPALDGSILTLLGISVATTGMSFAVDHNAGSRPYTPTRGFLWDMTTGFDDKQQIHRYQAVVVNLLLLFVGILHVFKQLTYPVFDETWLLFLGISGVTAAAGKAFENQKPESSHIPTTASSNADSARDSSKTEGKPTEGSTGSQPKKPGDQPQEKKE